MRILRSWLIALLVPALLLVAAYAFFSRTKPLEVRLRAVERGKVEQTVSSTKAGAVRSRKSSDLSVETAGAIVAIHAREGRAVKAGEHLVSIDRRDADAVLAAATGEQKVLESLAVEAAARRKEALRELERLEQLHRSGVATESQLDTARMLGDATAAALAAAEARVEAQKTVVARAAVAVEKCDLHAPFDGVVAEVNVEVGEWALPGQVAMRLLDPLRVYVRAELDEVDIGQVRVDLPARVTLDPYRDRRIAGKVVRIAPYVSELLEQNRTLEIEVELTGGIGGIDLKPGTSADVEVILREIPDTLRIPASAILEGDQVFVVDAEGRARRAPVTLGLRNWEYAQLLDGLREGDRIIVSLESELLKEGVPVREAAGAAR